jgi:diguanylate cyclase (GGDEF)-like protein
MKRLPPPPDFDRVVTDRLTGTFSYHYLRLRLDEELQRAARYGRPLALVLIDVDDLRDINDRYGRAGGDFALKQVGAILLGGARAVDRVGRWAGGAFALVLPETGLGAAWGLAERMRADVAARRFGSVQPDGARPLDTLRVSVSCGIAASQNEGRVTLVARADEALHRAKLAGRNRSAVDA